MCLEVSRIVGQGVSAAIYFKGGKASRPSLLTMNRHGDIYRCDMPHIPSNDHQEIQFALIVPTTCPWLDGRFQMLLAAARRPSLKFMGQHL